MALAEIPAEWTGRRRLAVALGVTLALYMALAVSLSRRRALRSARPTPGRESGAVADPQSRRQSREAAAIHVRLLPPSHFNPDAARELARLLAPKAKIYETPPDKLPALAPESPEAGQTLEVAQQVALTSLRDQSFRHAAAALPWTPAGRADGKLAGMPPSWRIEVQPRRVPGRLPSVALPLDAARQRLRQTAARPREPIVRLPDPPLDRLQEDAHRKSLLRVLSRVWPAPQTSGPRVPE